MAKLVTVVAMVVGGWFVANHAVDSVMKSHADHAAKVASATAHVRGM